MVMNVHNLFPLSVKTILLERGRKRVLNVPLLNKWLNAEYVYEGKNIYEKKARGSVLFMFINLLFSRKSYTVCLKDCF